MQSPRVFCRHVPPEYFGILEFLSASKVLAILKVILRLILLVQQ